MPGLRFRETMAGAMRPVDGGAPRRLSFTVSARARRLRHMVLGGPLRLEGTVTLEDDVTDAPAHGTLIIDPLRREHLIYEVMWRDADGRPHRFRGSKIRSLRAPVSSMTELHGRVYREGEVLGEATLAFDLSTLPAFLASMRPSL
ncbi:MAG: hypothetical protein ACQEXJ_19990 [Myxococcota bacterium]